MSHHDQYIDGDQANAMNLIMCHIPSILSIPDELTKALGWVLKFADYSHMVADIRTASEIRIHQIPKKLATGEPLFLCQSNMLWGIL